MKHNGFTLIELMIVVAVVGVLAAIALPQYQLYTMRAKAAELVGFAQDCKTRVTEYYTTNGTFPTSDEDAGCPNVTSPIGKYTGTVDVMSDGSGIVRVTAYVSTFGTGGYIDMVPTTTAGALLWTCTYSPLMDPKLLPPACRNAE